ncbi:MAG: hypothetical protein HRF45_07115 [Fimbriimonadia bacterium]|jgi:hypothetical protein
MKKNVSPWWIVVIAVIVLGGVWLIAQKVGAGSDQHSTQSALDEMAKQKAPGEHEPLQEGGVLPGSGMVAPSVKGSR